MCWEIIFMSILRYCVNNLLEEACYLADILRLLPPCVHTGTTVIMYPVQWCFYSSLAWVVLRFTHGSLSTSGLLQSIWTIILGVTSATTAEHCSECCRKNTSVTLGESRRLLSLRQGEWLNRKAADSCIVPVAVRLGWKVIVIPSLCGKKQTRELFVPAFSMPVLVILLYMPA